MSDKPKERIPMEITARDKARMGNPLYQLWRFVMLNLKILKAVDQQKRS